MNFDLGTLIVILAALAAFVSVMAAAMPFIQRGDNLASRLKAVADRRKQLSDKQRQALQAKSARFQPKRHVGLMRMVLGRLKLQNMLEDRDLKAKLAQAGWRRQSAAVVFVFGRIALPIVMLVLTLLYLSSPGFATWQTSSKMLACLGAAVFGAYLPALMLSNTITKRQKALERSFPDALDLMVICVEAGVSIEAAFQRVTEEMADSAPIIAEEIALTSAELAFLGDRRQAYENLAERTGLAAIKSLATSLMQSERYGTPVSVALRVLSQENREARMSAAEKKAASLPAKLTVPMIVFFLPVLFMVIIGPAAIQVSRVMRGH
ncbi:MAG TPA: type II secretion system F family protein [Patescibacteria group bacterium]|nr:type II secretion system F family protein [Patescibacteria group bacterium]